MSRCIRDSSSLESWSCRWILAQPSTKRASNSTKSNSSASSLTWCTPAKSKTNKMACPRHHRRNNAANPSQQTARHVWTCVGTRPTALSREAWQQKTQTTFPTSTKMVKKSTKWKGHSVESKLSISKHTAWKAPTSKRAFTVWRTSCRSFPKKRPALARRDSSANSQQSRKWMSVRHG